MAKSDRSSPGSYRGRWRVREPEGVPPPPPLSRISELPSEFSPLVAHTPNIDHRARLFTDPASFPRRSDPHPPFAERAQSHFVALQSSFGALTSSFVARQSSFAALTNSFAALQSSFAALTSSFVARPKAFARAKNRTHHEHLYTSPAAARRSLAAETECARTRPSRKNRSPTSLLSCTLPATTDAGWCRRRECVGVVGESRRSNR